MGASQYLYDVFNQIRNSATSLVNSIGWADIVDILIIAFLIYRLARFLQRSRLVVVARSIVILVLVVWISGRANLLVVNFIMGRALELGILALVILFQPEIRQILERVGRSNIMGFFGREIDEQELESAIIQTVIACTQMAKDKTGALIVFERNVSLQDEIKTGTVVEAKVSSELLKNIFYDKAPLHDGAVIIRDGRIVSAGCMLPLSNNANLSRDLGMRHRAGIGVSERSDAVTVIVSEETGSISVATEGMLRRHLAQDTFETLLRNELIAEEQAKRRSGIFGLFKGKKNEKSN